MFAYIFWFVLPLSGFRISSAILYLQNNVTEHDCESVTTYTHATGLRPFHFSPVHCYITFQWSMVLHELLWFLLSKENAADKITFHSIPSLIPVYKIIYGMLVFIFSYLCKQHPNISCQPEPKKNCFTSLHMKGRATFSMKFGVRYTLNCAVITFTMSVG